MTPEQARELRSELARFLRTSDHADVDHEIATQLREQQLGQPIQLEDGLQIAPWQLSNQTNAAVELTWTLDLGHESGTRRWLVAHVDRLPTGWKVREISLAHAHALRRPQ